MSKYQNKYQKQKNKHQSTKYNCQEQVPKYQIQLSLHCWHRKEKGIEHTSSSLDSAAFCVSGTRVDLKISTIPSILGLDWIDSYRWNVTGTRKVTKKSDQERWPGKMTRKGDLRRKDRRRRKGSWRVEKNVESLLRNTQRLLPDTNGTSSTHWRFRALCIHSWLLSLIIVLN